ncbi:MAG: CDGSH iron-sulfur domain-containing protein [Saezia sp.]
MRGNFELESADRSVYGKRNCLSLCRCGASSNKAFCDASHIEAGFNDKED